MHALLVDDERLARVELRRLLDAYSDVAIVGEAANLVEAEILIRTLRPDLIFLDIEMPGGDTSPYCRDCRESAGFPLQTFSLPSPPTLPAP